MVISQRVPVAGSHPGSPPPLTVAVLVTGPATVGVTGIAKLTEAPGASPAGITQRTACSTAAHPAGSAPRVRLDGTLSATTAGAVVAAAPSLNTEIVYVAATATVKLGGVATLAIRSCGTSTVVTMAASQRERLPGGHPGSPPPLTRTELANTPPWMASPGSRS